jgi:predicted alpha/beta superfamily hydrolase
MLVEGPLFGELMGEPRPATIESSEVFDITSERTGEDYRIFVGFPAVYGTDTESTFPGIYVLDGNGAFPVVTGMVRTMQGPAASNLDRLGRGIPPALVVGIGWPVKGEIWDRSSFQVKWERRTKEYSGFVDPDMEETSKRHLGIEVDTGGANDFLGFLVDQLFPLLEARYRLDPNDRTLWGASLSGHFALYALLHEPGVFRRLAVTSPALGLSAGGLFDLEAEYAYKHDDLPARLFLGIGEEERPLQVSPDHYLGKEVSVWDFYRFASLLEERDYPSLTLRTKVYEGHGHTDVIAVSTAGALLWLFSDD